MYIIMIDGNNKKRRLSDYENELMVGYSGNADFC